MCCPSRFKIKNALPLLDKKLEGHYFCSDTFYIILITIVFPM